MLNHILTSANRYSGVQVKDGIIDASKEAGDIKEVQTIIDLGPQCTPELKVGQRVLISPKRYMRAVHSLNEGSVLEKNIDEVTTVIEFPMVDIRDKEYLYLYDTDVEMIILDCDEIDDDGNIVL